MRSSFVLAFALTACTATIEQGPPPSDPGPTSQPPAPTATATATATVNPTPTPVGTIGTVPKACTKMGCNDALVVDLAPKKPFGAGRYTVVVTAGDKKGTCEISMPFPKCGTPATRCEGTLPLFAAEQGCDGPIEKQTFSPIRIGETPAELKIEVKKGAAVVMSETVKPDYKKVQPNGPDCGPVCNQGAVTVSQK